MLGFVVPFKSKAKSKNWKKDSYLLYNTLQSILGQTDPAFRCYVVYTDLPDVVVNEPRIKWIKFPFPFRELADMADRHTFIAKYRAYQTAPLYFDQGKRALYGSSYAIEDGCDYIMMFDADDLVSNRLAGFVNSADKAESFGWYVEKGFIYNGGRHFLEKVPTGMNQMHGSVNIVRADLVPKTDFTDERLENYVFFAHHMYLWSLIEKHHGKPLKSLPFYATIYVVHDTGWSSMVRDLNKKNWRTLIRKILRAKYISRKISQEFGLLPNGLRLNNKFSKQAKASEAPTR